MDFGTARAGRGERLVTTMAAHTHNLACISAQNGALGCVFGNRQIARRPSPPARPARPRFRSGSPSVYSNPSRAYASRMACYPVTRTPKLTRAQRAALPDWCFAIPETRDYPLTDKNKNWDPYHAKAALTHVLRAAGRHGPNPKIARRVVARVQNIFPEVYRCELDLIQKIAIRHRIARSR